MDFKWTIALVLGFSALSDGCGERLDASRAIGGAEADPNSIPWQILLEMPGSFCGGTIICEKFVMTAAHCVENFKIGRRYSPSQLTVFAEEHNKYDPNDHIRHRVKKIHRHPKWGGGPRTIDYDFAILELRKPIDLTRSSKARAVCLPSSSDARILKRGTDFVASGWGRHIGGFHPGSPAKLRHVTLPWQPQSSCQRVLNFPMTPNMICAGGGGKGVCNGDSGGPLTWVDEKTSKVKLMGVSSFVADKANPWGRMAMRDNGQCNHLSVFADITKVLDWIQNVSGGCNGGDTGDATPNPAGPTRPTTTTDEPTSGSTPDHLTAYCRNVQFIQGSVCEPGFCSDNPTENVCSPDFCENDPDYFDFDDYFVWMVLCRWS